MLIQLRDIKKYFPLKEGAERHVRAVDDVSLSIEQGESLGLVGESGSGKTTLGRVILKLYSVDSGEILLQGTDITHLSQRQIRPLRKNVQMVFQDPYSSLDPRYTVRSILKEALAFEKDRNQQEKKMEEALFAVGLTPDVLNRFPHEFSGGERQRIAIARSLIMNPKLLILDEAVSSLDVLIQKQIIDLLQDLREQYHMTYLFITHNLRVVRRVCDRIAVMVKGKIVEVGKTDDIFNNPLHPYTKELLSSAMDYRSKGKALGVEFSENSRLIDRGNGHFVIN